ncbi:PRC-barrel domain-containing protein [Natrialbaceae archaeon AArc-T1-2]|uniref:PRC-barrel domain-containing protein n=1 Tax=Natrialbaceae archaeon AArc-T1-2 TaxID=3053904 RepID=UPI00255B2CB2|nr:PRC-barrel domain-containing protein [Natrialbaceae archaeon AArc-T1-2]WIV67428.1 PRC-barrel domain-containing protein [Natrialbaceae archaeon AArc-T1-2]
MNAVLARNLQGMSIVGTDGTTVGTLYDVTMDRESGRLCDLVVDPERSSTGATETDDGRVRIPVSRVKTMGDQIVIDTDSTV